MFEKELKEWMETLLQKEMKEPAAQPDKAEQPGAEWFSQGAIKDIYLGNMDIAEWIKEHPRYREKLKEYNTVHEEFLKSVPDTLQEKFEEVCLKQAELSEIEEENAFTSGFRLGARLMLEMLSRRED